MIADGLVELAVAVPMIADILAESAVVPTVIDR